MTTRPRRRMPLHGPGGSGWLATVASWAALALALGVGVAPLVPPPVSESDPASFSASRAFAQIERIAVEPHPIGSPANQAVREEIVAQLAAMGLEAELETVEAPNYYGTSGASVAVVNILARIPGTAPTGAVALMGHYDTVSTTAGANDNSSAVAVMLEAARAIRAGNPLRNDVMLLFTDGEEPAPRFGSAGFVAEHPWADEISFVINLEAFAAGPSMLIEVNGPERWVVDQVAAAVAEPAAYSYLTDTVRLIGGSNTDFAPFPEVGIAGVEWVYLHGSTIYHTAADRPDSVRLASLQQHGANALALARHVGNLDLGAPRADGDAIFFRLAGMLVRYPAGWGLPIALLAGMTLLAAVWRRSSWLETLRSLGIVALTLGVAALTIVLAWGLLAGWRSDMGLAESYAYLAGVAGIALGISATLWWLLGRRMAPGSDAAGVLAAWWGIGLLVSLVAPGIGYLFVWPALVGALALAWAAPGSGNPWSQAARLAVVGGLALILVAPAIDTFYQFAQPRPGNLDSQILPIIVIPTVLIVLLAELLRTFRVFRVSPSSGLVGSLHSGR